MKKLLSAFLAAVMAFSLFATLPVSAATVNATNVPVFRMTNKFSDMENAIANGTYTGVVEQVYRPAGSSEQITKIFQFTLTETSRVFINLLRGPSANPYNYSVGFGIYSDAYLMNEIASTTLSTNSSAAEGRAYTASLKAGTYYIRMVTNAWYSNQDINYNVGVQVGAMSDSIKFIDTKVTKTSAYADVQIITNPDCVEIWVQKGQINNQYSWTESMRLNGKSFRITNNYDVYTIRILDKYGFYHQTYVDLSRVTSIKASAKTLNIEVGQRTYQYVTVTPARGAIKWTTSNKSVAAISVSGTGVYITGKKPGTATITCAAQDGLGAKATIKVTVKPKKASGIKISGKTKATIKWTKQKDISGYEVKLSTNSKFKKKYTKTYTLKGAKKNKKVTSTLKKNKTYYVKVRAYKQVGKKKIYGDYSYVYYFKRTTRYIF